MKKLILTVIVLGVATVAAVRYSARPSAPAPANPSTTQPATEATLPAVNKTITKTVTPTTAGAETNLLSHGLIVGSPEAVAFAAEIDTLTSAHSTFVERQAAWKELMASGRIQDAIAELEQRAANDPKDAEVAATLGQAYLKACATTKDVRSQAIWAMEADKSFDAALSVDPENWDARFTKSVAMTYWPDNLNKSQEIIDNFNTLISQQEKEAPQPQFASAYLWLGQQYVKAGQQDMAQQVWQRGASLYPNDSELQKILAPNQTAQQ
jgi:tetratricopeptide (TPR) repeat protein